MNSLPTPHVYDSLYWSGLNYVLYRNRCNIFLRVPWDLDDGCATRWVASKPFFLPDLRRTRGRQSWRERAAGGRDVGVGSWGRGRGTSSGMAAGEWGRGRGREGVRDWGRDVGERPLVDRTARLSTPPRNIPDVSAWLERLDTRVLEVKSPAANSK